MHMLLKNGFGYAISKSALSLPKKMEADITDLSKYTEKVDIHGNSLNYMYRIIDYPQKYKIIDDEHPDKEPVTIEIKNKMLLTFSKKRQQHDLAVLEEKFGKARKAVAERAKIKTANKGFSSFLSADIDTKKLVAKKIKMKLIENCTGCGECATKCPYHLKPFETLPKHLADYMQMYEARQNP